MSITDRLINSNFILWKEARKGDKGGIFINEVQSALHNGERLFGEKKSGKIKGKLQKFQRAWEVGGQAEQCRRRKINYHMNERQREVNKRFTLIHVHEGPLINSVMQVKNRDDQGSTSLAK